MAKTTIGLKNIGVSIVIIRELNDCVIPVAATITVSDTNTYAAIKWSTGLYNEVNGNNIRVVIDGVELSKEDSLVYLQDNTITGGVLPIKPFSGTSAVLNQNNGVVPDDGTPSTGLRYLADDGTWDTPAGSPTALSIGTKTATTLGITSDGGVDDVILPEVTITEAGLLSAADKVKLDGIEVNADVTDAANVDAAGAVMNTDVSTAAMAFVIDEDNMISDSDTKVPTQQSVKAYVDNRVASSVEYQGGYDASAVAPNGAATKGDMYTVTVAGTGGGYFSTALEVGDVIISEIDSPLSETDWTIVNKDLDAASIKVSYESNADTNAFTDAEKTKLGNITGTNTGDEVSATDAIEGIVELATQAEVNTGTDTTRVVTPDTLEDKTYGTFTGTTISDNNTLKGALQELETALETVLAQTKTISISPKEIHAGLAGTGVINYSPVLFYNDTINEDAWVTFKLPQDIDLTVNPVVRLHIAPNAAQVLGSDFKMDLDLKYLASGELTSKTDDENLTNTFTVSNTARTITTVDYTLDASLMAAEDLIAMAITRDAVAAGDDRNGDAALILVEFRYTAI